MGASVGSLVVSLGLDAAEYTTGLTKAQYQAYQFGETVGKGIRSAVTLAASGLAALGLSAGGAVAGFNELIKSAGDFQDLAEKTGASAEGLASFGVAAGTAGVSVDAIAAASIKLTKNLTGVDDESKAAGAAVAALGLNLKDFKALSPEAEIEAASKALAGFEEGAGKTAVATALFGKSGADLLPFLKTLEEQGGRNVILTEEQIQLADEYGDKQAKLKAEIGLYAQVMAVQALPALTAFTGAGKDAIVELLGMDKGTSDLKNNKGVADFATDAVRALGFIVDAGDGVVRTFQVIGTSIGAAAAAAVAVAQGEIGQAKTIITEGIADVEKIMQRELFSAKLARRLAEGIKNGTGAPDTPARPKLVFDGATKKGGAGDDPTKKELDTTLKALDIGIKQEEELLRARNKMLDLYNGENLLSTEAYFAGKRVAQEVAVEAEAALYDKQIAALQAYQSSASKATEREGAQAKINDLTEKKSKLYRDAGEAALEMGFKERKAVEDLGKQIASVNADILELTGNFSAASKIRLDAQYKDLSDRLTANGDSAGLAVLDRLKQLKTAQADIGQQSEEIARINENLRIQEDRASLSRQIGADSELGSLIKVGAARQAAVKEMQAYVASYELIARSSGSDKMILGAAQARLELEKLQAVADPLGDKINSIFTESFGNAFADFIIGTKSAAEAFQAFGKAVINQLANIAAQEAATALFGKSSASSSSSGLFKTLLGAAASFGGAGASMYAGDALGMSINSTYGTSTQAGLDALFNSVGGRANGGDVNANQLVEVNERGPELLDYAGKQYLMMGDRSGNVIANRSGGSGMNGDRGIPAIINMTQGRVDDVTRNNDGTLTLRQIEQVRAAVAADMRDPNGETNQAAENYWRLERSN